MNKIRMMGPDGGRVFLSMILSLVLTGLVRAAPSGSGEAIVAAMVGRIEARIFDGPIHEGRTRVVGLSEGLSIGEASQVTSGRNGRACIVLSPGAILCVAPQTAFTFTQLRQTADGLPRSEQDLIRRIHIELHRGRILLYAGSPSPTLDMRVRTPLGEASGSGGTFVVAQTGDAEWAVISEEHGVHVTPTEGAPIEVPEGEAFRLSLGDDGVAMAERDRRLLDSPLRKFEVCDVFFDDLESFFFEPGRVDRPGLSQYLGEKEGIVFVGEGNTVLDVSPSVRQAARDTRVQPPAPGSVGTQQRWSTDRINQWYDNIGVVKGVNYIPRNAVNSIEMWMADTFDPDLIAEELDWARDAGYTSLRVKLQYVVWREDPEGFLERVDEFLDLAHRRTLSVVPVLFDDRNLAQTELTPGPQPDPVPGRHNAWWVPSPGAAVVTDREAWPDLERYVREVIGKFRRDHRILYWDLYNRAGDDALWEQSLPLMDQVFLWARDVDPRQPLAVSAWTLLGSAMTERKLERSDLITFSSFDSAQEVEALLMLLQRHQRPVICSDWLMRQQENTFEEMLPLFSTKRVGWFNRGLVNGRVQEWIQDETHHSPDQPDVWQHDVLTAEGEPYDEEEIRLIREFRFQDRF